MDLRGWFVDRIDATEVIGALAVGDLVAITLFVAVGQVQHGGTPLADPGALLEAALPFYVAWPLVALPAGLYTTDATVSARRAASWSLPAWIVAVVFAQPIRAVTASGNASLVFAAVAMLFGGVLVVGWRTGAAVVLARS